VLKRDSVTALESVNFFRDRSVQDDPYAYFDGVHGCARPTVPGFPGARSDRLLGRPDVHARAGDAGGRGPPPRVDGSARRHASARRPAVLRARLVGAVGHPRRPQHQQAGPDARSRQGRRTGAAAAVDRDLRRRRRELHAASTGPARVRRRRRPRHPGRRRHGADAGLRARRPMAGRPGLRVRHRGRLGADLDDRLPGPETRSRRTAWATRTRASTR
jgi:hypothetical protein